ncbi:hypothetical protein [Levilactobacillus andaensis]|uniref:hypothetical protein n=1 Tax=Levilactobacillus andaensis TaxID=2799570 RepID=UPI001940EEFC|nr:hypothetical protein [Levilactobacillus andaensis]
MKSILKNCVIIYAIMFAVLIALPVLWPNSFSFSWSTILWIIVGSLIGFTVIFVSGKIKQIRKTK